MFYKIRNSVCGHYITTLTVLHSVSFYSFICQEKKIIILFKNYEKNKVKIIFLKKFQFKYLIIIVSNLKKIIKNLGNIYIWIIGIRNFETTICIEHPHVVCALRFFLAFSVTSTGAKMYIFKLSIHSSSSFRSATALCGFWLTEQFAFTQYGSSSFRG